jgi:myo-inositol-1(or 4)-monophosphatase
MGSAALAMTYVADGRFDAYIEHGIRLWDIAAGALIVEQAGGQVHLGTLPEDYSYAMQCSNHELNPSLTHLVY